MGHYFTHGYSEEMLEGLIALRARNKKLSANQKIIFSVFLCVNGYEPIEELEEECHVQLLRGGADESLIKWLASELSSRYCALGQIQKAEELAKYLWENSSTENEQMTGVCTCRMLNCRREIWTVVVLGQ